MAKTTYLAAMVAALGLVLGACGGPEGEGPGDDGLASTGAALSAPAAGTTAGPTLVLAASTRTAQLLAPSAPATQTVTFKLASDSSPDPIPAQPKRSVARLLWQVDCSRIVDPGERLACLAFTSR